MDHEQGVCRCCGARSTPTKENVLGAQIAPFIYLLLFNCSCGSTRAVTLWEAADDEAA
jgi:hypothetical protein